MRILNSFFDQLYTASLWQALVWSLLGNALVLGLTLVFGKILVRIYQSRQIHASPPPICSEEIVLAFICFAINSLVALLGILMWQNSLLQLRPNGNALVTLLDTVALIALMDFGMYLFHRVAHHPWFFPIVHLTHHKFEHPRPLTLFVLNPFEVLGFGALLIIVMMISRASPLGILVYLTFNVIFGLVGHLGVEPAPSFWIRLPLFRLISTSTFHAQHHMDKTHNFGFYTLVWDQLFRTLSPHYMSDFRRATSKPVFVKK